MRTKAGKSRPMIISVSRKTDIPAFYAEWFINRVRAGYCTVPNPFNPKQISRISLKPEDVAVFVFWTRNPRPLMRYLDELDERGYKYYFQYTLLDNPRELDPKSPSLKVKLDTFRELSQRVGQRRVIWRYDPIVLSSITTPEYHLERHAYIANQLKGYTFRNVISIVDEYKKTQKRTEALIKQGIEFYEWDPEKYGDFVRKLVENAQRNEMEIVSCAEPIDLQIFGVRKGKCIDDDIVAELLGCEWEYHKDKGQREACGCTESRDIGMYDTCLFGCVYCYATSSFEKARLHYKEHDPNSPSLLGHYEVEDDKQSCSIEDSEKVNDKQLSLLEHLENSEDSISALEEQSEIKRKQQLSLFH